MHKKQGNTKTDRFLKNNKTKKDYIHVNKNKQVEKQEKWREKTGEKKADKIFWIKSDKIYFTPYYITMGISLELCETNELSI